MNSVNSQSLVDISIVTLNATNLDFANAHKVLWYSNSVNVNLKIWFLGYFAKYDDSKDVECVARK